MDFERGLWNAARKVFGNIKIRGCWFHYNQAIFRKAKSLGLYRAFRNKKDVIELIRNLMTLPLMDVPAIYRLFETLKKMAKRGRLQSIDKLFEYMERYWVDGVFTPEDWSCYGYDIRTNNEIECWNGRL